MKKYPLISLMQRFKNPVFLFFLFILGCWLAIFLPVSYIDTSARLIVESSTPQQEVFQVFWADDGEVYSTERMVTVLMKPGRSTFEVTLPALQTIEKLRIDPLVNTGSFILYRLSLIQGSRPVLDFKADKEFQNLHARHNIEFVSSGTESLQMVSLGEDPQIELKLMCPGWTKDAVRHLFIAILLSMFAAAFFYNLHSPRYRISSGSLYPASSKIHVFWYLLSILTAVFLIVVTPLSTPSGKTVYYLPAAAGVIATTVYLLTFWLATRPLLQKKTVEPGRWSWFFYALPSYFVWLLYLFAFWPGSMSPDSLDQWRQVLAGITHFKDWHPAFHTLTIWLLTRVWLSPAMVVLAQITVLGGVAGWCLAVLQRWGVPRYILWLTAIIFAGWLVNGLMVITLWKDIAYSTALLALTVILFQLVMSRGKWLDRSASVPVLALVLFCVAIYRHNGVIPAFVTSFVLLLIFSCCRKKIFIAFISAFLLFIAVRGPVYSLLDVRRGNPLGRVVGKTIQDVESFLSDGQKGIWTKSETKQEARSHESARSVARQSKRLNPMEERLFASSRLWRIQPLEGFHRRIEYVNLWSKNKDNIIHIKYVSSNRTGNDEESLLPQLMERLYDLFEESKGEHWFVVWRPAVYLYVFLASIVIAGYRLKSWRLLLLSLPVLLNSLPTLFFVIHKSIFRYHYGIILVSLLFTLPLLFLNQRESAEEMRYLRTVRGG